MKPDFLTLDEILRIHEDQIERYGGEPAIRDVGLLLSAAAQPQAAFGGEFLQRDLFEMGAAYLFHIVRNHPFVDGNKRTGAVATLVFLALNDIAIKVDQDALAALVMEVAQGKTGKPALADFLRRHHEV